jgi:hypothetical protein
MSKHLDNKNHPENKKIKIKTSILAVLPIYREKI